jgi:hypothetical protein
MMRNANDTQANKDIIGQQNATDFINLRSLMRVDENITISPRSGIANLTADRLRTIKGHLIIGGETNMLGKGPVYAKLGLTTLKMKSLQQVGGQLAISSFRVARKGAVYH